MGSVNLLVFSFSSSMIILSKNLLVLVPFLLSAVNKLHNQIASWDTKFEMGTKTALLQPFSPVVIAADESERIRYTSLSGSGHFYFRYANYIQRTTIWYALAMAKGFEARQ